MNKFTLVLLVLLLGCNQSKALYQPPENSLVQLGFIYPVEWKWITSQNENGSIYSIGVGLPESSDNHRDLAFDRIDFPVKIIVDAFVIKDNSSRKELINTWADHIKGTSDRLVFDTIKIDNISAYVIDGKTSLKGQNFIFKIVYFEQDEEFYRISFYALEQYEYSSYKSEFEELISTIRINP